MTWTKLGDEFIDDAADLSDAAFRLHVEALCWSNRRLLDLCIDKRALRRFAAAENTDPLIVELTDAGWWEDRGDHWWIGCRFPEWQQDRVQVEHRRRQLAEAQRRRRLHALDDHSLCLPRNCRYVRESTDDSTVESWDDPGRDGYGTGEQLRKYGSEESTPGNGVETCEVCGGDGRGFSLIAGLCRRCYDERKR